MQKKQLDPRYLATARMCAQVARNMADTHPALSFQAAARRTTEWRRNHSLAIVYSSNARTYFSRLDEQVTFGAGMMVPCVSATHVQLARNMRQCCVFGVEDPATYLAMLVVHELAHAVCWLDPITYPDTSAKPHSKGHVQAMRKLYHSKQGGIALRELRAFVAAVWPTAAEEAYRRHDVRWERQSFQRLAPVGWMVAP